MLSPIPMTPAYRYGAATPWGGDGFRTFFSRNIPDPHTGESLEVSALPGLCSRDGDGAGLDALILRYGERLTGTRVAGMPLLLKLLDARDTLSVQVHPDDAYAAMREGKRGKTEAWVILRAQPGASLILGVRPGITRERLACAAQSGAAVEACLCRVPVRPGDVYPIPAGMAHAIGKGILLYEIQQSSDVTYRFYDWERTDAAGNKRALHLSRALDVTDVTLQGGRATPVLVQNDAAGLRERLVQNAIFTLERLTPGEGLILARDARRFAMITAVGGESRLTFASGTLSLRAGDTALLPADGFDLCLTGGQALLAAPALE